MQVIELKPVLVVRKPYAPYTHSKSTPILQPGVSKRIDSGTYNHRMAVISKLWRECSYRSPGTLVRPAADDAFEKNGLYRVVSVCATWNDYKGSATNELKIPWPANDNPMIVVAINLKTNKNIEATTNYFIPYVDTGT
jgi:hypothetical protein